MSAIFKKLNLRDQKEIMVINAPGSFEPELENLGDVKFIRDLDEAEEIDFSLAFVIKQKELDEISKSVVEKARGDALVWFAYPKKPSKKYKCDFSRDTGWHVLGEAGFEGVRQVAIDEDWSAIRFRHVDYIKSMTRDQKRAMSQKGKKGYRIENALMEFAGACCQPWRLI